MEENIVKKEQIEKRNSPESIKRSHRTYAKKIFNRIAYMIKDAGGRLEIPNDDDEHYSLYLEEHPMGNIIIKETFCYRVKVAEQDLGTLASIFDDIECYGFKAKPEKKFTFTVKRLAWIWYTEVVTITAEDKGEARKYLEEHGDKGICEGWDDNVVVEDSWNNSDEPHFPTVAENGGIPILLVEDEEDE